MQTNNFTKTDKDNAKFVGFAISDGKSAPISSPLQSFYPKAAGAITIFAKEQRSVNVIRATFVYIIMDDFRGNLSARIMGVELKNVDSSGNVTNRTGSTKIFCFLLTT
jgi:hypothetical protein